jgi:superfamily II DNA or RNA helicase
MQEYGLQEKYIGRIYDKIKKKPIQWAKTIVITTWQSLKNNMDKLKDYDVIIGDECHQVKAHELKKIFSKSTARYRLGFTGTMPDDILETLNTKAFLGPVLREYSSGLLGEQGYISKCTVKILDIDYPHGIEAESYTDVKKET